MRRRHRGLLLGLILCIIVGLGSKGLFASDIDEGYKISDYKVVMNVHEDSSVSITEEITVHFNEQRHGILRDMPTKLSLKLKDEEGNIRFYTYRAKVTDVQVSGAPYEVASGSEYTTIKIGDEDKMIEGDVHYTISYVYSLGDDRIRSYDMFYFNIIGVNWNTEIDHVNFKVNFPKDLDLSKLDLHRGQEGTVGGEVTYEIGHNEVTGTAENLGAYEGITMKVLMPEGYYTGYKKFSLMEAWIICILQIIFLGYMLFKLLKQKNGKIIESVEFYPPDDLSSAEVGYILNGKVTNKELLSLFLWLASKGYIKIENKKKGEMIFSKGNKRPTQEPEYIREMYDAIFAYREYEQIDEQIKQSRQNEAYWQDKQRKKGKRGKKSKKYRRHIQEREDIQVSVSSNELGADFYRSLNSIKVSMEVGFYGDRALEVPKSREWIKSVIAALLMLAGFMMCGSDIDADILIFSGVGAAATLGVSLVVNDYRKYPYAHKQLKRILGILALLVVMVFNFMIAIWSAEEIVPHNRLLILIMWTGIISVVLSGLLYQRTPYKTQTLGKLLGLRSFIKTAELERINALVEENPSYFYDVLPFAYVFGLTNKWIKQFETIKLESPDWYEGCVDQFSTIDMMDEMDYVYAQAESEISRYGDGSSSSSSDSDSSCGDGAGGGGGSSW